MTVNELLKLCKSAAAAGNGNKTILLSDDDEGNGFHEMLWGFTTIKGYFSGDTPDDNTLGFYGFPKGTKNNTHIILG